jgi:hypothetical protein
MRERGRFGPSSGRADVGPKIAIRSDRTGQKGPGKRRSAAMMFAFVIALVGIAVLGGMDLAAAHR